MCYSAQVVTAFHRFEAVWNTGMSIDEFVRLYGFRLTDKRVKIAKAMDLAFAASESESARRIKELIGAFNAAQTSEFEQELFKQRKRLADAERTLATKPTKVAAESQRIATSKVEWLRGKLDDLRRTEAKPRDSRIFPGWYGPVMVLEQGRRVIKPMRYQCRPAGKPAIYDAKYPGTYNARRDSLEGFWKKQFGHTHGIMIVDTFFENVTRTKADGTTENVVLQFKPDDGQEMLVACLWSRWTAPGEPDLLSFAAITDEPPAEVAAAGHDRCIVPIKPENIDAWLNPDHADLAASYAILDDRPRPYYEHLLVA